MRDRLDITLKNTLMEPFFLLKAGFKPNGNYRRVVRKEVVGMRFGLLQLLFVEDLLVQNLQVLNDDGILDHPIFRPR